MTSSGSKEHGGWWEPVDSGIRITVRAVPNSSRNQIVGVRDGALVVRLRDRPGDRRADDALVGLIVQAAGTRRSSVRVRAGATARRKVVQVNGVAEPPTALLDRLSRLGGGS